MKTLISLTAGEADIIGQALKRLAAGPDRPGKRRLTRLVGKWHRVVKGLDGQHSAEVITSDEEEREEDLDTDPFECL